MKRTLAKTTRVVDRALLFLHVPSIPDLLNPFGFHFLYGLGGEDPEALKLVKALCGFAHNFAREPGCGVVARGYLIGGCCHVMRIFGVL